MKAVRAFTLVSTALFSALGGCSDEPGASQNASDPQTPQALSIRAGAVKANAANPRQLRGSFIISPASSGPSPIPSLGTGGACLIADLNAINLPSSGPACNADAQCQAGLDSQSHGYCVTGRCWVRPGGPQTYCVRSVTDNNNQPWQHGTHAVPLDTGSGPPKSIDVSAVYALPGAQGKAFDWRFLACLNGYNPATQTDNGACGGAPGPIIVDYGETRSVN